MLENSPKAKLTIVISSYHREHLLKRCRFSLGKLLPGIKVCVINDVNGLANARNLGWQKAKGEYVAYIDDDAVAEPDWISNILRFIDKHPEAVAFGGPYTALNREDLPDWIPEEVHSKILPIDKPRPLNLPNEWLNGTNMIFRKNVLEEMGGFDENLGVSGNKRAYGEETDLQIRLHNAGYDIWYDPSIRVRHEFLKFKQNMFFLLKDQYLHGLGSSRTFRHLRRSDSSYTAQSLISRIVKPGIPVKTRIYFAISPFVYLMGKALSKLEK